MESDYNGLTGLCQQKERQHGQWLSLRLKIVGVCEPLTRLLSTAQLSESGHSVTVPPVSRPVSQGSPGRLRDVR